MSAKSDILLDCGYYTQVCAPESSSASEYLRCRGTAPAIFTPTRRLERNPLACSMHRRVESGYSVGPLWETGRRTVLSAGADTSAPEFAYSGDNGPGFWGETPGREACAGTARTRRQSPIDIDHIVRQQGGRRPAVRHRQDQSLRRRLADEWFADEERRRSERPLADDQRGGRADQHVAVPHVSGSLTTPPCAETVTWCVLHEYAQLSSEQSDAFRHILGNNFRPLQKRNGRTVRSTVGEDDER